MVRAIHSTKTDWLADLSTHSGMPSGGGPHLLRKLDSAICPARELLGPWVGGFEPFMLNQLCDHCPASDTCVTPSQKVIPEEKSKERKGEAHVRFAFEPLNIAPSGFDLGCPPCGCMFSQLAGIA
jgi:hypothetical protein